MFFLRLVIPEGLGTVSLKAGTRGCFQGSFIESECVGVALTSQVDEGEPLYAAGTFRLFQHWAWVYGTSSKKLMPWVVVRSGFAVALEAGHITRNNLSDWLADGHPLDLPAQPVANVCCIEPDANENGSVTLLFLYDDKAGVGEVQIVASEPRLSERVDGLKPTAALKTKRVAIVGVGSGGSIVAVNLAAAGVGTLHLFDRDVLTEENIFRHACDVRHIGRAKVLAVKDQIASYDLPAQVGTHHQDVVNNAGNLWALMSEADLVLCATDSILSRRLVNYVAVRSATPLVIAGTFENASIGEIIRVRPGESACYECTRLALSEAVVLQLLPDAEESGTHIPYVREVESGEGTPAVSQGSRADISMVAALQSRVAINTLLAENMSGEKLPTDYLTWGVRSNTDLAGPFNFERPFSTNWVHLDRQDACPVCRDIGRPVDQESDTAYQEIMAGLLDQSA